MKNLKTLLKGLPFRVRYEMLDGFYTDRVTERRRKDGSWKEIKRERINRIKSVFEHLKWILES